MPKCCKLWLIILSLYIKNKFLTYQRKTEILNVSFSANIVQPLYVCMLCVHFLPPVTPSFTSSSPCFLIFYERTIRRVHAIPLKASDKYTFFCTFTSGLCACDKARQVRREEGRGHWKMCVHTRGCGLVCVCVCVWSPVIRSLWRRKAPFNVLVSAASHHSDKHTSSPAAVPVISHQSSSPACPCPALPGNALYVS